MLSNSIKFTNKSLKLAKATPEQIISQDLYGLRAAKTASLVNVSQRNKISWTNDAPYNKRWQYKWKHAYYAYPRDGHEHDQVKKPEDTAEVSGYFNSMIQDVKLRMWPGLRCMYERRHRCYDLVQLYALPFSAAAFYHFSHLAIGFKFLAAFPLGLFYVRLRDRTQDPDMKETFLREMMYNNPEISELFSEETIHVMDYEFDYDKTIDYEKFPEYRNKVWSYFNSDSSHCSGHFKFGDLESGATMTLKIKTMPVPGKFRYQVGEPFYFYDLRADIVHNGVYKEVVLVDEAETLKKTRPFLFLI